MSVADARPSIHRADKNLHPLSANDLYFGAGSDHLVGGTDDSAPKLAANSYITSRSQISLRYCPGPNQPCRSGHARFIGAAKKGINQQVFEQPSAEANYAEPCR